MTKVVVDTNVWVSALLNRNGTPAQIRQYLSRLDLFTSEEILAELARVLHYDRIKQRYRLADETIDAYLAAIRSESTVIEVTLQASAVERDPTDNKFLACAEQAEADYIVSGDPHLVQLTGYRSIPIMTPAQFLAMLRAAK